MSSVNEPIRIGALQTTLWSNHTVEGNIIARVPFLPEG